MRDVATVRFSIKTGANEFFYVKDITDTLGEAELAALGLTHRMSRRVRVIETEGGDRQFNQPTRIAVGGSGNVYVAGT